MTSPSSLFLGADPDQIIGELRRLLHDLERVRRGSAPTAAELQDAPLLDGWSYSLRPVGALAGRVVAHPLLGDRRLIATSELFAADPVQGWARTYSRFYRLGVTSEQRSESAHG